MNNEFLFVIDLEKSKSKTPVKTTKAAPVKAAAPSKKKEKLEGGEWKTVRGARVYIKDGAIVAGADGHLSDAAKAEYAAIHDARVNKKDVGQVLFLGTEVRVGKERRIGKVHRITDKKIHIDYDGKVESIARAQVRRADAYKLKLEDKIQDAKKGKNITIPQEMTKEKAAKKQKDREDVGVTAKTTEQHVADIVDDGGKAMRETPVASMAATMLRRDEQGAPMKKMATLDDGSPDIDAMTGKQKEKYVTYEKPDATEDEVIRDHQGLVINEIVNPYAKRYGLEYIQREWRDADGNPTDLYGDLVQTANIGFLHGLREHVHKTTKGEAPTTTLLTHALQRSRDQVRRHAQEIFNGVPLPEKLLSPLAAVSSTEEAMEKKLERKPTHDEMVNGVEGISGLKDNMTFNSLKMKSAPRWDSSKGKFDDGVDITDHKAKLEAVYAAKRLQKVGSIDSNVNSGNDDDKEVTIKDNLVDKTKLEADREMKERSHGLRSGVSKLLGGLLDDRETKLIMHRFGIGNKKQHGIADLSEVAEAMGISVPLAKKISSSAMNKLKDAPKESMDRLKKLYMTKSLLGLDTLMKALFVFDLQKSLESFGLSTEDLETTPVRTATGSSDEIKKSLGITEFIGSIVSIEGTSRMHARIVEYGLPDDLASVIPSMEKAFAKSENQATKNTAVQTYIKANASKYAALAKKQASKLKGNTWSEQLLQSNPGSCWITWHGERILIHGTHGAVIYASSNASHREKYHPMTNNTEFSHVDDEDTGHVAVKEEMEAIGKKFKLTDPNAKGATKNAAIGGHIKDWREAHKNEEFYGVADKNKINKLFPAGKYLVENPYTGKQIVMSVDITNPNTESTSTAVTNAFDPSVGEKVNIGSWNKIYEHIHGEKNKKDAGTALMNEAHSEGKHSIKILTDEEYSNLYNNTTEGAKSNMVHKKFRDVTPDTMKVMDKDTRKWNITKYAGNRVYEADLGGDRFAKFEITPDGTFSDPVMQQLVNPMMPINDANDLYKAMKGAIGNETWVTISSSKLTNLNHHVKLRYDGQGAPVVVGGAFDGYRFQDAAETDDPDEKAKSLFKNGQPVRQTLKRTDKRAMAFEVGGTARIRNPKDKRNWIDVRITGTGKYGKGWEVEMPPELVDKGITFEKGATTTVMSDSDMRHKLKKLNIATEAPVVDTTTGAMLSIAVPESLQGNFEANYGVSLDLEGRAVISIKQFMELRDAMGGASLTHSARNFLEDFYSKQQRDGMQDVGKLLEKYNPANTSGYKDTSFLKKTNLYSSQVEGIEHLMQAEKGIAGHGMGTGKTLLGVGGSMYLRDKAIKEGRTPGKTLIISPASIQNEWLKEINRHTNVGAVLITNESDSEGKVGDVSYSRDDKTGEYLKDKNGNHIVKEDLRSRTISPDSYRPSHKEHFAVMSYQQFTKNPEKFIKWAKANNFENVIIDEVHAFKTDTGDRNKQLGKLAENTSKVWGLSGTPIDNEVTDIHSLVHTITGGKHDLGSKDEFNNTYLYKEGGKVVGMNESKVDELGKKLAKYVQFRNGYTDRVNYVDGTTGTQKTVQFPHTQAPNKHRGELAHVSDFEVQTKGDRSVNVPKPTNATQKEFYDKYKKLEAKYLTESQRSAIESMEGEGSKNYLQAVQRLQQFMNAPNSEKAYYTVSKNAEGKSTDKKFPSVASKDGHPLYYEGIFGADGKPTGYKRNKDGSPVLLPPMHHNNPRADKLKETLLNHMAEVDKENQRRVLYNKTLVRGEHHLKPLHPKVIISSKYDTFGVGVVENILRDIHNASGKSYGKYAGGGGKDRNNDKVGFKQNNNMGFMVISDAGKEGIDLGNAQMVVHYDNDFNPNVMAQKSARALRSDSWVSAKEQQRANEVKILSISQPGTVDDNIFKGQDRKVESAEHVERATRKAEGAASGSDYAPVYAGSQRKWGQKRKNTGVSLVTTKVG